MHLALPETADFMAAELSRENLEDNIATAEGGGKEKPIRLLYLVTPDMWNNAHQK